MNIFQMFGSDSFEDIEQMLAQGIYISAEALASAIQSNPDQVLPGAVRDYLVQMLEGKVRAPRGRKRGGAAQDLRNTYARVLYESYLAWLQAREHSLGLSDCPTVHWWQGPPHERAARMAAQRAYPNHSWRHVLNMVSRQR